MARRYRFLMSFTSTIHQCLRHWWSQHLRRSHPGKDGFFRAKNAKRCGRYVTFYINAETSKPVRLWLLACTTAPSPSPQLVWLGEWGHELLQLMPYHRHFPFQGTLLSTLDNINHAITLSVVKNCLRRTPHGIYRATIIPYHW